MTTEIEITEYKGNKTLTIHTLDKDGNKKPYPFSFGLGKAESILNHVEEIKKFVEDYGNKKDK